MRMDWAALKAAVAGCRECPLHAKRKKTVSASGTKTPTGSSSEKGRARTKTRWASRSSARPASCSTTCCAAIGLKRGENVYIANVVKCRPPGNRNPEPDEMQKCEPFLQRQIELIQPKLIVALGRIAAENLLATRREHREPARQECIDYQRHPLIVTYHPAYLLRNLPDKAKAWEDLCFAVRHDAALAKRGSGPPHETR